MTGSSAGAETGANRPPLMRKPLVSWSWHILGVLEDQGLLAECSPPWYLLPWHIYSAGRHKQGWPQNKNLCSTTLRGLSFILFSSPRRFRSIPIPRWLPERGYDQNGVCKAWIASISQKAGRWRMEGVNINGAVGVLDCPRSLELKFWGSSENYRERWDEVEQHTGVEED